jgi:hypothetical protein
MPVLTQGCNRSVSGLIACVIARRKLRTRRVTQCSKDAIQFQRRIADYFRLPRMSRDSAGVRRRCSYERAKPTVPILPVVSALAPSVVRER